MLQLGKHFLLLRVQFTTRSIALPRLYARQRSSIMASGENPRAVSTKPLSFENLTALSTSVHEARLGKLLRIGRRGVETPNYFPLSSRGSVPHLSQDTVRDHTAITGIHTALEDCKCCILMVAPTPKSRHVADKHALAELRSH